MGIEEVHLGALPPAARLMARRLGTGVPNRVNPPNLRLMISGIGHLQADVRFSGLVMIVGLPLARIEVLGLTVSSKHSHSPRTTAPVNSQRPQHSTIKQ